MSPSLGFVFDSRSHLEAMAELASALKNRDPLTVVKGPAGSGKTTLGRAVLPQLQSRSFGSFVDSVGSGLDDLLARVLDDFGVVDRRRLAGTSVQDLTKTLEQFLSSLAPLQAYAVVIVDEAQRLEAEALERLRLLLDFEVGAHRPLQLILVGRPELQKVLNRTALSELKQLGCRNIELSPLETDEVGPYVEGHLHAALGAEATRSSGTGVINDASVGSESGRVPPVQLTPAAISEIARWSGGWPGAINLLCKGALEARDDQRQRTIDAATVRLAARRLKMRTRFADRPIAERMIVAAAAFLGLVLICGGTWLARQPRTPSEATGRAINLPARAAGSSAPLSNAAVAPAQRSLDTTQPAPGGASVWSERFTVVVASFRTAPRASAVAADVAGMGLPSFTRVTSTGWQQVVLGPYVSRDDALEAQRRLTRAGIQGSHLETNPSLGSDSGDESNAIRQPVAPPGQRVASGQVAEAARLVPPPGSPLPSRTGFQGADVLERARALSARPDVKALERLRSDVLQASRIADPRQDPVVIELDRYLEEARRLQLTVDARGLQQFQSEQYREAMLGIVPDLDETSASLAAWSIGSISRPDSRPSARLASRLRALQPPGEIAAAHERLCLSLESLTTALADSAGGEPAAQASQALAAIAQAKGTLQEFLRTPDASRARR